MKKTVRIWLSVVICLVVVVGSFVGGYLFSAHQLNMSSFPTSQYAYQIINQFFVDPIQDEILAKGIVYGTGDPYSLYFTKEEYDSFTTQIADHYVGIGVIISENLEIIEVFVGSPANLSGVVAGDFIVSIEKEDMSGKNSNDAAQKIRGPEHTSVEIEFQYPGEVSRTYKLTRKQVKIPTVQTKMLKDHTAYIKIRSFNFGTAKEFDKKLKLMIEKQPKQIILDLRNNGGGVLEETQSIAEYFLPEDSILFWTIGKDKKAVSRKMNVSKLIELPIAVLVNKYSASASEVLSGAIQDYKTGIIIGEKTYGKASIQRVFKYVPTGGAIKLTVEKYLTPNKRNIMGEGLSPDLAFEEVMPTKNVEDDPCVNYAIDYLSKKE
ncbi:MAG: S41 family peptidase [Caldisericia bacterium]|nr:S41 family peptidase [Caldisericia bacterium]